MSYITTRTASYEGAKPEKIIDVGGLAEDLARELGGELLREDALGHLASFKMADGLVVHVSAAWNAPKTERVTISSAGLPDVRRRVGYTRDLAFPEITVDVKRPLEALVKDVRKRVIEASADPVAKLKERDTAVTARYAGLIAQVNALRAVHPAIEVTIPEAMDAYKAPFVLNVPNGLFLRGDLHSDGKLTIERVDARSVAHAATILAAVLEPQA